MQVRVAGPIAGVCSATSREAHRLRFTGRAQEDVDPLGKPPSWNAGNQPTRLQERTTGITEYTIHDTCRMLDEVSCPKTYIRDLDARFGRPGSQHFG